MNNATNANKNDVITFVIIQLYHEVNLTYDKLYFTQTTWLDESLQMSSCVQSAQGQSSVV